MNPQMRMLILLGVFGTAGSLLLAAESPSTSAPQPAATANKPDATPPKADAKAEPTADKKAEGDAKTGDAKADAQQAGKGSIAEQAEAALKAAAEADAGSTAPKEPPKDVEQDAKDETHVPPSGSTGNTGKGPSPQRFVPTEQVRADFDVSFPIDI